MTTPFVCVLIAFALIWLARIPMIVALGKQGGVDNKYPHRQLDKLASQDDLAARAVGAHRGLSEAFAPFAAAVVIASIGGADPRRASVLAIAFVVCEVLYAAAYLANVDYLRAFVWLIGLLATLGLFVLAV